MRDGIRKKENYDYMKRVNEMGRDTENENVAGNYHCFVSLLMTKT